MKRYFQILLVLCLIRTFHCEIDYLLRLTEDTFDEKVQNGNGKKPWLVLFLRDDYKACIKCKINEVFLMKICEENLDMVDCGVVNVDKQTYLTYRFQIKDIPILYFIKDDKIYQHHGNYTGNQDLFLISRYKRSKVQGDMPPPLTLLGKCDMIINELYRNTNKYIQKHPQTVFILFTYQLFIMGVMILFGIYRGKQQAKFERNQNNVAREQINQKQEN